MPIPQYYQNPAPHYDADRFGNSYGQYIDRQEKALMQKWSTSISEGRAILDLACGTGRFMEFATHGSDISAGMIEEAKRKFPDKKLAVSNAQRLPFEDHSFDQIHSFHLMMHLSEKDFQTIIRELERVLKPNGMFIFDVPSKHRRALFGFKKSGWHGASSYRLEELQTLFGTSWKMEKTRGILFFPIHRFPSFLRPFLRGLDTFLCRSLLKKYASYIAVKMQRT